MHEGEWIVEVEQWYYIPFETRTGAENMAIDHYLLDNPRALPILRGYNFTRPTLTLGRYQKIEQGYIEQMMHEGIDVVKRVSGGRSVLHVEDFTYSLTFPKGHKVADFNSIKASYQAISGYFQEFFNSLGIEVEVASRVLGEQGSSECFASTSYYELTYKSKKLMGSAQSRNQKGILQHGTLYVSYPRSEGRQSGEKGNTAIVPLSELGIETNAKLFYEMFLLFLSHFHIELKEYTFSNQEWEQIQRYEKKL